MTLTTGQPTYANRVGWAISRFSKAGALTRPEVVPTSSNDLEHTLVASHPAVTRGDVESVTGYSRSRGVPTPAVADIAEEVEALDPAELIDQGIKRCYRREPMLIRLFGFRISVSKATLDLII